MFFFFHLFSLLWWKVLKSGYLYNFFMLLIILMVILIRSSASVSLWCEILSIFSQFKKINIMFWRPTSARPCNRFTQNKGSEVLLPLLKSNYILLINWSVAFAILFCKFFYQNFV